MRLITLDECATLTDQLFDRFVMPLAVSNMTGEIPTVRFAIHRHGTKNEDWLASVRYKHTMAISVFQCEVWLEDIFRLCRRCRIWLITREVFQIVVLYAMLHPIYQTECMDFNTDVDRDYESMMVGAGKLTYEFIQDFYPYTDEVQPIVLEILKYHMMEFTNHWYGLSTDTYRDTYRAWQRRYEREMLAVYEEPYKVARARKANITLLDYEGFLKLERITESTVRYDEQGVEDATLEDNVKREEGYDVPENVNIPYGIPTPGTDRERGIDPVDTDQSQNVTPETAKSWRQMLVDAMAAEEMMQNRSVDEQQNNE